MKDAFISYSRLDGAIGRKLYDGLIAKKRDLWMDWRDIPVTAEWWKEITTGIEISNNFVFLLSPNSLSSPICQLEIDYARANNKRLKPVLISAFDETEVLARLKERELNEFQKLLLDGRDLMTIARDNLTALSSVNWIVLKVPSSSGDILAPLDLGELITALDIDLDYIREHTRILIRTRDWEQLGNAQSLLLRGDDLIRAEKWLEQNKDGQNSSLPLPTDKQTNYISASRIIEDELESRAKMQVRRTRQLRNAAVIAALIGVGALISTSFAIQQSEQAFNQVSTATVALSTAQIGEATAIERERNANIQVINSGQTLTPLPPTFTMIAKQLDQGRSRIESLRLAAQADAALQGNLSPIVASQLAVAALRVAYTSEADSALMRALTTVPVTRFDAESNPTSIVFSPNGRFVLTSGKYGPTRLWDAKAGTELRRYAENSSNICSNFTPSIDTLWTVSSKGALSLWNTSTGLQLKIVNLYTLNRSQAQWLR